MYPHKAQQKISVAGLTVDDLLHRSQVDLLHRLQNVPKCRAAGRPRRSEHVLGEHLHGQHVEGTYQTAQVSVPQCRRPALLSNPATRRAQGAEEDGGRFKRCLGEGVSQ